MNVWGEDMLGDGWREGKGWNEGKVSLFLFFSLSARRMCGLDSRRCFVLFCFPFLSSCLQEKLRKIIGIWNKYNCFSPEIRNELQALIDESDRLAKGATSGTTSSVAASHDHHRGKASASIGRENDVGRGRSVGVTDSGMSIGVRGASTGAGVGAGAAGTGFSGRSLITLSPDLFVFNPFSSVSWRFLWLHCFG